MEECRHHFLPLFLPKRWRVRFVLVSLPAEKSMFSLSPVSRKQKRDLLISLSQQAQKKRNEC